MRNVQSFENKLKTAEENNASLREETGEKN